MFVSNKQIDHLLHYGPDHRYYELLSVAEVVKNPMRIFQDLMREGQRGAFCYVGQPQKYGDGWEAPGPPEMLFVVGVTSDWVAFEWRWETADSISEFCPTGHKTRFGKTLWKHSSIL